MLYYIALNYARTVALSRRKPVVRGRSPWRGPWRGLRTWSQTLLLPLWEIRKIRGTLLGVPIRSIRICWGLYWGPPIQANYLMRPSSTVLQHNLLSKLLQRTWMGISKNSGSPFVLDLPQNTINVVKRPTDPAI